MIKNSNPSTNGELRLSEHFQLKEFTYSRVAIRYGIDNTPPPEAIHAMSSLCVHLLEPLRVLCGNCPMHVLSGYRCVVLNKRVGGVSISQHLTGEAADIYIVDIRLLLRILRSADAPVFDQAIYYCNSRFVHLSYSASGENRRQLIYI